MTGELSTRASVVWLLVIVASVALYAWLMLPTSRSELRTQEQQPSCVETVQHVVLEDGTRGDVRSECP